MTANRHHRMFHVPEFCSSAREVFHSTHPVEVKRPEAPDLDAYAVLISESRHRVNKCEFYDVHDKYREWCERI